MTHIENVPHILKYGITHKNSPNFNSKFVTIGDVSLINTRAGKSVRIDNGEYTNLNVPKIILGDFIPFYFGVRMPMLYVMQHGGNFVKEATPAEKIVYLACDVYKIIRSDIRYYFTDGHATDNLTTFYDKNKIERLPTIIDWTAIKSPFWSGQENLNLKRKKQAEFLIANDLPPEHLFGFGCYNGPAKQKLVKMGIGSSKIKVIPKAYY